jgi:soluble lytic murein transglycosylase-like protein
MTPRLAAALLVAANAFAGEYAILASGSSMRVDRHEQNGAETRVYLNGGSIDFPARAIVGFEQEYVAPEPKPAAIPQQAAPAIPPRELVSQAAERWHLPPSFLHAVVRAESGYRADAVSPKGAIGLMQLMPGTARLLGADPADPRQNVDAGARYLTELLRKYVNDPYQVRKAVAAYNAGPAAVDRYDGVPPYPETTAYVERVIRQWLKK